MSTVVMIVKRTLILAAWATLALSSAARSDVIRVEYAGTVTQAGANSGVAPGSRFSGSFAFDPSASGGKLTIEGASQFYYGQPGFPTSSAATSTLFVGGLEPYGNTKYLAIYLSQSDYAGQFSYADGAGKPYGPMSSVFFHSGVPGDDGGVSLSLYNPGAAVLPSPAWDLALPTTLDLSDFPIASLTFSAPSGDPSQDFAGTVDTLRVVPEPSTLALMGVVGVVAMRMRRR